MPMQAVAVLGWVPIVLCFGYGNYIDEFASVATLGELHRATDQGIEGVVFAYADIQTRVVLCAALTFDDVACFCKLAAENFDAKSFAF